MTVKEILAQLESLGDKARRAHNTKAGAPANQFGVKLGNLRAIAKKIKTITSSRSSSGTPATSKRRYSPRSSSSPDRSGEEPQSTFGFLSMQGAKDHHEGRHAIRSP